MYTGNLSPSEPQGLLQQPVTLADVTFGHTANGDFAVDACGTILHTFSNAGEKLHAYSGGYSTEEQGASANQRSPPPCTQELSGESSSITATGLSTDTYPPAARRVITPAPSCYVDFPRSARANIPTLRPPPSRQALKHIRDSALQRARLWESIRSASLSAAFRKFGVQFPVRQPAIRAD
ncbi:hypothetical protein PC123_g23006 [Phytophthora cactorum]|nr:hypothetical protein PC123_g23006 [Phytophthora cactorum]